MDELPIIGAEMAMLKSTNKRNSAKLDEIQIKKLDLLLCCSPSIDIYIVSSFIYFQYQLQSNTQLNIFFISIKK
jgi:hypothetical protein